MDLRDRHRVLLMSGGGLPPTYKRCDYLQTTAYNARIDTGVPGNDETLVFEFDYETVVRAGYAAAFGNNQNDSTRAWRLSQASSSNDKRYLVTAYTNTAGNSASVGITQSDESVTGKRVHFRISSGLVTTVCDGDTITTSCPVDSSAPISTRNIGIGASHPGHSGGSSFSGRFWYFKIWSGGVLIRNYVPCIRLSDSKAGFYDLAHNTFNPSIGTVDFIAGYDN